MTTWNQCRFLMMHEMKYCCPVHSEYSVFCSMIDTSCADLTGQKRPAQQLQTLPCTSAHTLCQTGCYPLLLHALLQANTSGRQLSSFSQAANKKHFPCHGSCFGKTKNIMDLMEFLNNYISLPGTSAVQAWIISTCTPAFCPFNTCGNIAS